MLTDNALESSMRLVRAHASVCLLCMVVGMGSVQYSLEDKDRRIFVKDRASKL